MIGKLYNIEMNQKLCRLWYELNSDTIIKVKAANGMTDEAAAGPCVGQGSSGGALNSQFHLDRGIQAYFEGSCDEYYYGSVRCQAVTFQDDTGRTSSTVKEAQAGNTKLDSVFKDKGVKAHPDKSDFLVLGSRKYKEEVIKELEHACTIVFWILKDETREQYQVSGHGNT